MNIIITVEREEDEVISWGLFNYDVTHVHIPAEIRYNCDRCLKQVVLNSEDEFMRFFDLGRREFCEECFETLQKWGEL